MRFVKTIALLACLIAGLLFILLAWSPLAWSLPWFEFTFVCLTLNLITIGVSPILLRRGLPAKAIRILASLLVVLIVLTPAVLVISIRHDRAVLQKRAKAFLSLPVPKLLVPDSDGYVGDTFVGKDPRNDVLGSSKNLIERYAETGRIRYSAYIAGQFAHTSFEPRVGSGPKADAIQASNEVRLYIAERNAILGQEHRMEFLQFIEDLLELKTKIPEIEEEDNYPNVYGVWTPDDAPQSWITGPSGRLKCRIDMKPDGSFSASVPDYLVKIDGSPSGLIVSGDGYWSLSRKGFGSSSTVVVNLRFNDLDGQEADVPPVILEVQSVGEKCELSFTFGINGRNRFVLERVKSYTRDEIMKYGLPLDQRRPLSRHRVANPS